MRIILIITVCLLLCFGRGAAEHKHGELTGLLKPNSFSVDSTQIYVTDGTTVRIYSLKDFKPVATFGKRGEGPGEFKDTGVGIKTSVYKDYLIVHSDGRETYFKKDGTLIKEKITNPMMLRMKPLGTQFVSQNFLVDREKKSFDFVLILYNKEIKKQKELYRFMHPFFAQKKINPFSIRGHAFRIYKNKLYIDHKEGLIKVFDEQGNPLPDIRFPYKPVKTSVSIRAKICEHWEFSMLSMEYKRYKDRIKFPDLLPHLRDFQVMDDKIFIITYNERKERGENEVFILDTGGKLLKRIWLPLADTNMLLPLLYNYYAIYNGKLYLLRQNPDSEEWELHIHVIDIHEP